jgi:hypothetical protein
LDHHSYNYYLESNKFKKTYFRESPATSCLKESVLGKNVRVHEAPDPIFIHSRKFDKYLNMDPEDLKFDIYDKMEVEYFNNMGNADYDEVAAEDAERK